MCCSFVIAHKQHEIKTFDLTITINKLIKEKGNPIQNMEAVSLDHWQSSRTKC